MPALPDQYPTNGSVQGPCRDGWLFFGPRCCGSGDDCRPGPDIARQMQASIPPIQPRTEEPTRLSIAYRFPNGEWSSATWTEVLDRARAFGMSGLLETWSITSDTRTGAEIERTKLGVTPL